MLAFQVGSGSAWFNTAGQTHDLSTASVVNLNGMLPVQVGSVLYTNIVNGALSETLASPAVPSSGEEDAQLNRLTRGSLYRCIAAERR
jgi:hypothetical protein